MTDDLESRALRLMVKLDTRAEHFSTTPITTKEGAALARLVLDLIRQGEAVISVEYECDFKSCNAGMRDDQHHLMWRIPAGESVDVYLDNWQRGAKLSGYLPEGWTVQSETSDGLAVVWCPAHEGETQ